MLIRKDMSRWLTVAVGAVLVAAAPLGAPAVAAAATSSFTYTSPVTYGVLNGSSGGASLPSQLGGSSTTTTFTSQSTTSSLSQGVTYSTGSLSQSSDLSEVLALLYGTQVTGPNGYVSTGSSTTSTGSGSMSTGSTSTGSTSTGSTPSSSCSLGAGTTQYVLCMTNAQRALVDAQPLALDPTLDSIAQQRANALAAQGTIAHDIPGLGYALAMEQAAGVTGTLLGAEDLSTGSTVTQAFYMLVTSPEHEANIQYAPYNKIGIAVASMADGTLVLDLVFIEQ